MTIVKPRKQRRADAFFAFFPAPPSYLLILLAAISLFVDLNLRGLLYATFFLFAAALIAFPNQMIGCYNKLDRWMTVNRTRSQLVPLLSTILTIGIFLLASAIEPAHAQFFTETETWMAGAFEGIDAALVALIFNVLRGLFVLYLGIALVRVIVAARNDDDWTTLARTPLIIVVAVTLGDVLAGYITGG